MSDGSREQTEMTVGLGLGDRYSYLCMLDNERGPGSQPQKDPANLVDSEK